MAQYKAKLTGDLVTVESCVVCIHTLAQKCFKQDKTDSALHLLNKTTKILCEYPELKKFEASTREIMAKLLFHLKRFGLAMQEFRTTYDIMCHYDDGISI